MKGSRVRVSSLLSIISRMSIIFNFNYTSSYVEQYKVTVNAIILIVKQMYENMRIMELTKSVQQHRKMEYIAAQKLVKCLRL